MIMKSKRPTPRDIDDFPQFAKMRQARQGSRSRIYNPPRAVEEVGRLNDRWRTIPLSLISE
jgi:hypothetical protein